MANRTAIPFLFVKERALLKKQSFGWCRHLSSVHLDFRLLRNSRMTTKDGREADGSYENTAQLIS